MRRSGNRTTLVALLCAGVVGLAGGCGGSDSPGTSTDGASPSSAEKAAASPTNWPQAADGVIDEKMCGILTSDDLGRVGVISGQPETRPFEVDGKELGIYCNYGIDDTLGVALAGTEADAKVIYGRHALGRTPLKADPMAGADQSVALPTEEEDETFVISRRGRLIVSVNIDPKISHLDQEKTLNAAITLAGLVLERAPQLGKA